MLMTGVLLRWTRVLAVACTALAFSNCDSASLVETQPTELAAGTWGGDNAGVIVSDRAAHVHIGCTLGDFAAPIALDENSRFSVAGEYLLRAYPVATGPRLPAQFAGVLRGNELTMTVAVNDTVEKTVRALGPVTVVLGRTPKMGPCPICKDPAEPMGAQAAATTR
jgi:hypothetical protein